MKRKFKLKSWVKDTLAIVTVIVVFIGIMKVNNNMTEDFITDCEKLGYSHNYCVSHS